MGGGREEEGMEVGQTTGTVTPGQAESRGGTDELSSLNSCTHHFRSEGAENYA